MNSVADLVGKAVPSVTDWQYLNLNHIEKAVIDQELCIQCGRCHVVCEDTSHQAITHTIPSMANVTSKSLTRNVLVATCASAFVRLLVV